MVQQRQAEHLGYFEARGVLGEVMKALKLEISDRRLDSDPRLHPGRAATLVLEGRPFGCFGQLHPALAETRDLPEATYLFELDLNRVVEAATRSNRWVTGFSPSQRSRPVNVILPVVDRDRPAADLMQTIRKAGKPLLEPVELIDRFEAEQLGVGKASQAFRLRYRGKSTLKDEEVQPVHEKIRKALEKQFGAELRS